MSVRAASVGAVRWDREWRALVPIAAAFLLFFFLPVAPLHESLSGLLGSSRLEAAAEEALLLTRSYAREHVVTCLIPAFFIAGAIGVFLSQGSVMRYLGPAAPKLLAYGVASVSGTLLAVCSCTVLPLFAGIYAMGAGLGPAAAFLYAGPAINALAIVFTAKVLGLELGLARAVAAIGFAVVIGLIMNLLFLRQERLKAASSAAAAPPSDEGRPLWKNAVFFLALIGILIFANWGRPEGNRGLWWDVYANRWGLTGLFALGLAAALVLWFGVAWRRIALAAAPTIALAILFPERPLIAFTVGVIGLSIVLARGGGDGAEWFASSWGFAKQILPLLLIGVLAAGALLGRPGQEALVPTGWVSAAVGGNASGANLFASLAGAFMYFATLTEVPILEGLLGNGMGQGPALALLLAGPALSLPSMLVIRSVMGTKRTLCFVGLVVIASTIAGLVYGSFQG